MWLCGRGQTIILPGASPWLMMVLSSATTGLLFCSACRTSSDICSCTRGTCAAEARQDAQCQTVRLRTRVTLFTHLVLCLKTPGCIIWGQQVAR